MARPATLAACLEIRVLRLLGALSRQQRGDEPLRRHLQHHGEGNRQQVRPPACRYPVCQLGSRRQFVKGDTVNKDR